MHSKWKINKKTSEKYTKTQLMVLLKIPTLMVEELTIIIVDITIILISFYTGKWKI